MRFTVNLDLIAEQYDQVVRVLASLRDRTAPADVVLQRLINAAPADRLDKALTALGGLDKTIHILRYIHDMPLRQAIHLQLNRGALAMAESRTCISVAIMTQRVIRVRCGATRSSDPDIRIAIVTPCRKMRQSKVLPAGMSAMGGSVSASMVIVRTRLTGLGNIS